MNIFHLKYFCVLAKKSNYREAADYCNVSQPAMSMAIKSLETKLGHQLFLRQKNPIRLSEFGRKVLSHAQRVVHEYDAMMHLGNSEDDLSGVLRMGVIPTIASSLIPRFIGQFIDKYPNIRLEIEEMTTVNVITAIQADELDVGIVATPLDGVALETKPLYYEDFMVYSSHPIEKAYILPSDLNLEKLWLLEEGHCLRSQIMNLCELRTQSNLGIQYSAGSIETLINLVDNYGGITIIPELFAKNLSVNRSKKLMLFDKPAPVREISLTYHRYSIRKEMINTLEKIIESSIPNYMRTKEEYRNIPIDL